MECGLVIDGVPLKCVEGIAVDLDDHPAARRIGVTSRWLRTEADAGRIPCLRADGRYVFDIDAVTRTLSRRAAQGELDTHDGEDSRHA